MAVKNISLPIPSFLPKVVQLANRGVVRVTSLFANLKRYFFTIFGRIRAMREKRRQSVESVSGGFQERKPRFPIKKYIKPLIVIAVLVVVFVVAVRLLGNRSTGADNQFEVAGAEKTFDINKEFTFPLKDAKGEKIAEVKYMVEKVELRDEIIVKGKRATAVKGRTFLLLNLKISNDYKQSITINTKDYVRLSVNGNEEEWLAPDIHNDPVEVQAISTKYTRVGFPINDSDKSLIIRIGEIEGEKEKIPLEF